MAIDIYSCNVCSEQYCRDCDESLVCSSCGLEICSKCENETTKSNYSHGVICTKCFKDASKEQKLLWEKGKFQRIFVPAKSQEINLKKIDKTKRKMNLKELGEMLEQLRSGSQK